jgi:hypothetical protein
VAKWSSSIPNRSTWAACLDCRAEHGDDCGLLWIDALVATPNNPDMEPVSAQSSTIHKCCVFRYDAYIVPQDDCEGQDVRAERDASGSWIGRCRRLLTEGVEVILQAFVTASLKAEDGKTSSQGGAIFSMVSRGGVRL